MRKTMTQEQKNARAAERWNRKQAEANPLFAEAGILEQVAEIRTGQHYADTTRRYREQLEEGDRRLTKRAEFFRRVLRDHDPEAADRADLAWTERRGPTTPEYRAEFFRRRVEKEGCA